MWDTIVSQCKDFASRISWSDPTWDMFIIVFLLIGTLIYGFSLGRQRIIMILVAVYIALVAVLHLPHIPQFGASVTFSNGFALKIGTFIGLFAILFIMLTRSALNQAISGGDSFARWWHIILLSFLQIGMLVSVVMSFLPSGWLEQLAPLTRSIFISPWGRFTWVMLPIIGLLIVGISNDRALSSSGRFDY